MLGNSNFSRYSYAADVESFAKRFSICNCFLKKSKYEVSFLKNGYTYNDCIRLNMMSDNCLSNCYPPPKYPTEMVPIDSNMSLVKDIS